jgi:hypothetical protein
MGFVIFHNSVQGVKSADDYTITLEVNKLSTILVDLDKYCNYSIHMAAMTSVGIGPWSEPVACHTAEDGKGLLKRYIPMMSLGHKCD